MAIQMERTGEQAVADRTALRASLNRTRAAFQRCVDEASADGWSARSRTTRWTKGEVLIHLTWALEQLPKEVENARRGKGMFNMPSRIADPASYWMIWWQARGSDPQSVRRRYDRAMNETLAALDAVPDSDWSLGAEFYGHGFHSVARLFEVPAEHLVEHTSGW